jgi:hypothetical protein
MHDASPFRAQDPEIALWKAALNEVMAVGTEFVRRSKPLDTDSDAMLFKKVRMLEKASRVVRLSIALQLRIREGIPFPAPAPAKTVEREVERETETLREFDPFALPREWENFNELGRRSTREVVEEMCATLGLPFDPRLWDDNLDAEDPEIIQAFEDWTRDVRAVGARMGEPPPGRVLETAAGP